MEEMREPTPVSKDMDLGLRQGPRRVATSAPETKTSPSPRLNFDAKQHLDAKAAATKNRASFDVARQQPSVDLPPRPSLDSSSSRLGRPSNSQKLSPRLDQPNAQLLSLVAMLQQQQEQQQQMQMKSDSFDLTAALSNLSLGCQQQSVMQQSPFSQMGNGQADQLNELLRLHLQQQALNSAGNLTLNQPGFPLNSSSIPMSYTSLPSVSDPLMLQQQLQQLQNLHGFRPTPGLRSSLDSTLSNGSGRIPARVSFDGVTSTAPQIFQRAGLNCFNIQSLQQNLLGGMGAADLYRDFVPSGDQQRTSTDSSVADSYGYMSGDPFALQSLRHPSVQDQSAGFPGQPSTTDDFISFNQGVESFTTANAPVSNVSSSVPFQP